MWLGTPRIIFELNWHQHFFSNQEEVETEDDDLFSLEYQLRHLPDELNSFENSLNDYENMLKNLDTQSESELD